MRVYVLYMLVAFLSIYAYRHWYRSLCGLILLMAVIEHPDMPKNMMDIQGLNPWNVLLANVLVGWFISRRREGLRWDMPRSISLLLILYFLVVLISSLRMLADPTNLEEFTTAQLISENLVNTFKWVIPGLLLFDGCRSRRRFLIAIACILGVYVLLALQIARWMPPSAAITGGELAQRSRKIILNEIGYHPVNASMMLAGGAWAILGTWPLVKRRRDKAIIVASALLVSYAQALTGGRMGYVTWGTVGLVLCSLRWPKLILIIPVLSITIVSLLPGVRERMFSGFGEVDIAGQTYVDDYKITSGRTLAWPHVVARIGESPIIGHGRLAMVRTGLKDFLWDEYREGFAHPHNAYLEWLLDNGILGLLLITPFYMLIVVRAARLLRNSRDSLSVAVGATALALVLSLLIASLGSQTFYPREGSVGMWCAICLMLRIWTERSRRPILSMAFSSGLRVGRTARPRF
ncbi:MAG: O-antigen ligase family protein [Phycisphaerae bacterium]|nr:O-antigen ligase family protein [Phycisphaerae bacterium]